MAQRYLTTGEPGVGGMPRMPAYGNRGARYVIKEDPPIEKIVRPFETPRGWPGQRRLPPEQDDQEALLLWGANINVNVLTLQAQVGEGLNRVLTEFDRDDEDSTEQEEPDRQFYETRRVTDVIRVSNPEDPSSWVDVERIKQITFNSEAEGQRTYVLRNPTPQYPPVIYI